MQISTLKTKVIAFRRTNPVRAKIVIDGTVLEQVSNFEYLGYKMCIRDREKPLEWFTLTEPCGGGPVFLVVGRIIFFVLIQTQ